MWGSDEEWALEEMGLCVAAVTLLGVAAEPDWLLAAVETLGWWLL